MKRYRVWHRTAYTYSLPVEDSVGQFHLTPRTLPWQQVEAASVTVDPLPGDINVDTDYFGNASTFFHATQPHTALTIESSSDVCVEEPSYDEAALALPWEQARPLQHPEIDGAWRAAEFAIESPRVQHVAEASAYAGESLAPGRPIGEAATDLMQRIFRDFTYDSKATTVTSTVADAMHKRAGVCQDFAHVALAGLRAHGIAARYVSGYLATQPPPGKARVFGADASHAWLAVWLPGTDQWLMIDPTNNQWANDRYVTVAWGRDYGDVAPVRGIIYTDAKKSTLNVSVDVSPLTPEPSSVYERVPSE